MKMKVTSCYNRHFFSTVEPLIGRECGCVKDDSEHAIFELGERERCGKRIWRG